MSMIYGKMIEDCMIINFIPSRLGPEIVLEGFETISTHKDE